VIGRRREKAAQEVKTSHGIETASLRREGKGGGKRRRQIFQKKTHLRVKSTAIDRPAAGRRKGGSRGSGKRPVRGNSTMPGKSSREEKASSTGGKKKNWNSPRTVNFVRKKRRPEKKKSLRSKEGDVRSKKGNLP